MKNIFNKAIWSIALVMGLYGSSLQAQVIAPYLMEVDYSTDIDYRRSPFNIFHNHVMIDNTIDPPTVTESPGVIVGLRGAVIDGYHKDNNDLKYFSFDVDTFVGGILVLRSDIIRCSDVVCSSFTIFFDSDLETIKDFNINAFTLDPLNNQLIFSIESDARINGSVFFAADLIRFNGTNFSLEYDSLSTTFSRYKNIDAVSLLPNNRYLVSFANDGALNEIFEYNLTTSTWSIAYTPLFFGDAYNQVNISSLMGFVQPVTDLIFQDGFE